VDVTHIAMRKLAGVDVPDTPLLVSAIEYARENCEPYLFNRAVRSWLFTVRIAQIRNIEHDAEVVALGTLLHDITLNERFAGPWRFEVEGARAFARQAGLDERRAQLIWDSVAPERTASNRVRNPPRISNHQGSHHGSAEERFA
jgi:hypothetical protein